MMFIKLPKTEAEAKEIAGSLSNPSKMPGYSYSIPASLCVKGSVLRNVPDSVCHQCYAFRNNYRWPNVQAAMSKRFDGLKHPYWVEAMVVLIRYKDCLHFRWHDSGDIQGVWHLRKIAEVCERLPRVRFWLPTRELEMVRAFGELPPNLIVRVSATMIDGSPPDTYEHTSTVVRDLEKVTCPSHKQDNKCGACRDCWDKGVKNIAYRKH